MRRKALDGERSRDTDFALVFVRFVVEIFEIGLSRDGRVDFYLEEQGKAMPVSYVGRDPLPDTFKDGAQALVEGRMRPDGSFEAEQIQAKCASKYEAAPNQTPGATQPGQTSNSVPGTEGKS